MSEHLVERGHAAGGSVTAAVRQTGRPEGGRVISFLRGIGVGAASLLRFRHANEYVVAKAERLNHPFADINRAVAYCEERIERPTKAHLILITDLYEGGNAEALVDRLARLSVRGVNVIVLLALTDTGCPSYDPALSAKVAALGIPVFACTPDQFPDLMATALKREDVAQWAADQDIKLIRPEA